MKWNNLTLNIQYPKDSIRRGVDKTGNHWSQKLPWAYGEILGTEGVDKEPVDVIVGDSLSSDNVYICTMPKDKGGEDKCLIGFLTLSLAKKGFLSCYGGDVSFLSGIKKVSVKKFRYLLNKRRGLSLTAGIMDGDTTDTFTWGILQPLPTGWNTAVENPGDRDLTPEERAFNTEISRRQGPEKTYVEVSQGADINISPSLIYSNAKRRTK